MKSWAASKASTLIALALATFTLRVHGQAEKPWQLPESLRPKLDSRLRAFIDAQANGDWKDVGQMLGKYRRGWNSYLPYTPSHRACLIQEMEHLPMIAFQYTVWEKSFSSEILSTPPERRWWTLVGEATFRQDGKEIKRQVDLVAYRDQGQWFFTPPPIDNDNASSHFTPKQLQADLADQVALPIYPGSPIQVVDLHVSIDKENMLSRQIRFRLRNLTHKRITGYGFAITETDERGSIIVGTGDKKNWIEPGGISPEFLEQYVVGTYWCEGSPQIVIEIQNAWFEDGTNWEAPVTADAPFAEERPGVL